MIQGFFVKSQRFIMQNPYILDYHRNYKSFIVNMFHKHYKLSLIQVVLR